ETHAYVQVYDHRHERSGYVSPERVRTYPLEEASAASILPVLEFLRDSRGDESLGIGLAALYLRVADAKSIEPVVFDLLGVFADRLARRASGEGTRPEDASIAQAIDVAASYGIGFQRIEREGRTITCYDGEAFRRVLALGASDQARGRAVLALTEPRCVDPK